MNSQTFDRRDQLIAAALEEFVTKDYEKASLNTIIKKANLSKGVFYYHFKNKESLYIALLQEANQKKWNYINLHTREDDYSRLDIFDRFIFQANISIRFAKAFPEYHQLGRMFLKEKGNPIYWKTLPYIESAGADILDQMITTAYEQGEISHQYPLDFSIKLLNHLFQEFESIFMDDPDYDFNQMTELLEKYTSFMRHGLST